MGRRSPLRGGRLTAAGIAPGASGVRGRVGAQHVDVAASGIPPPYARRDGQERRRQRPVPPLRGRGCRCHVVSRIVPASRRCRSGRQGGVFADRDATHRAQGSSTQCPGCRMVGTARQCRHRSGRTATAPASLPSQHPLSSGVSRPGRGAGLPAHAASFLATRHAAPARPHPDPGCGILPMASGMAARPGTRPGHGARPRRPQVWTPRRIPPTGGIGRTGDWAGTAQACPVFRSNPQPGQPADQVPGGATSPCRHAAWGIPGIGAAAAGRSPDGPDGGAPARCPRRVVRLAHARQGAPGAVTGPGGGQSHDDVGARGYLRQRRARRKGVDFGCHRMRWEQACPACGLQVAAGVPLRRDALPASLPCVRAGQRTHRGPRGEVAVPAAGDSARPACRTAAWAPVGRLGGGLLGNEKKSAGDLTRFGAIR
jgi:hypothetical protein